MQDLGVRVGIKRIRDVSGVEEGRMSLWVAELESDDQKRGVLKVKGRLKGMEV